MISLPLRRHARAIATALLCLFSAAFTGCAPMRTLDAGELESRAPVPLRVTLNDGSVIDLVSYVPASGMLIGTGSIRSRNGRRPFNGAIPLERITLAEVSSPSAVLLAILAAIAAGTALVLLLQENPVQYTID
jgi:hypothetical protein